MRDDGGSLICTLCPRKCCIKPEKSGYCGVRKNIGGELITLAYGHPVAMQVDPIEKKPLAEFLPGSKTFSIGTYGCNLGCLFCQNAHLSRGQYSQDELNSANSYYSPEKIVDLAIQSKCQSIAFTYNEPLIWSEYIIDIAKIAKLHNLATVLVSNAYISIEAAKDIFPYIDAANFDMKGFSEKFYMEMTGGRLESVLDSIEYFFSLGRHLELTNLVIPGQNDSDEMISAYLEWVSEKLSRQLPLHFSAYFPMHKYHDSPPTPRKTLFEIKAKALNAGCSSIYLGNIR
jgi:pyruvate formate lyase activating enzyme